METQATLTVSSSVFRDGETIPQSAVFNAMGCTGDNKSPDLTWSGAPAGTKSYAVTIWDPDAPTGVGFVHWILFHIPGSITSLPGDAGSHKRAEVRATHGTNDFGNRRYDGPCPPPGHGVHHYHLVVYALDDELKGLDDSTSYAKFKFMSRSHVLATGEIVGLYEIPGS